MRADPPRGPGTAQHRPSRHHLVCADCTDGRARTCRNRDPPERRCFSDAEYAEYKHYFTSPQECPASTVKGAAAHGQCAHLLLPLRVRDEREYWLRAAADSADGDRALKHAPAHLKDDPAFIFEAWDRSQNRCVFRHASEALKDNREFMLDVVDRTKSARVMEYASEALRGDAKFMLEALETTRDSSRGGVLKDHVLSFASRELRDDEQFMLAVLDKTKDSDVLARYASDVLKITPSSCSRCLRRRIWI